MLYIKNNKVKNNTDKLVAIYYCPNCRKNTKKLLPYDKEYFLKLYSLLQNTLFDYHPIVCKRCFQRMLLNKVLDFDGNIILNTNRLLNSGIVQHYQHLKN
jgi:hypothetical protein